MLSDEIKYLIKCLNEDIEKHKKDEFDELAEQYDDVYNDLLIVGEFEKRNVQIAMNFWDGWNDSSNHDWQFYEPIKKDEWIELAKTVILSLENDTEITNKIIIQYFAPENQKGCFYKFLKGKNN